MYVMTVQSAVASVELVTCDQLLLTLAFHGSLYVKRVEYESAWRPHVMAR